MGLTSGDSGYIDDAVVEEEDRWQEYEVLTPCDEGSAGFGSGHIAGSVGAAARPPARLYQCFAVYHLIARKAAQIGRALLEQLLGPGQARCCPSGFSVAPYSKFSADRVQHKGKTGLDDCVDNERNTSVVAVQCLAISHDRPGRLAWQPFGSGRSLPQPSRLGS